MSLPTASTPRGAAGLAALLAEPARAVIALDYDGTLAPIVEHPEHAQPAAGAVDALVNCARAFGTLALITGRPALGPVHLAGLDGVGGLEHLVVLGHYGDERWTPATGLERPEEHPGVAVVRARAAQLLAELGADPAVIVEDKGISVALHTRAADDPDGELARLLPAFIGLAVETGLEIQRGRLVLELRAHGTDKGQALRSLLTDHKAGSVLFAGDDVVDAPAFAVVAALRDTGCPGVNVFVENHEVPAGLREQCDIVLPSPDAMIAFLHELAAAAM